MTNAAKKGKSRQQLIDEISRLQRQLAAIDECSPAEWDPSWVQFEDIFEHSPIGMALIDLEGVRFRVNPALADFLGYTAEELSDTPITSTNADPEALQRSLELRQKVIDGELKSYSNERSYIRKDGEVVWGVVTASLVRDDKGTPLYFIAHTVDITEQKRAMERLRESEERYREIIEVSSDWLWEMDSELRFSYLSAGYLRGTGIDPVQTLGKTRLELASEEDVDLPNWRQHMADLEARREFRNFQYTGPEQNGRRRSFRVSGGPVFGPDGTFLGYRGTASDVSEIVEAENNLRESEERYRQIAEVSSDWVWEMDADLRFSYFSPGFEGRTGVSPAFSLGKTRQEILSAEDLESPEWREHLTVLENRQDFRDFEYWFDGPGGKKLRFRVSGRPIFGSDGVFQGYRGTTSDITDVVRATEKARQSERQLRRIMEDSPVGISILSMANNERLFVNRSSAEMMGYDSAEDAYEIVAEESYADPDQIKRLRELFGKHGRIDAEEVHRLTQKGTLRCMLTSWRTIEYEGEPARIVWHYDITERKETEHALRENRELLRGLADHMPEFVSLKDRDGRFQFVNRRFEEWVGVKSDDVIGKTVHDIYPPEQAQRFAELDAEAIATGAVLAREIDLDYPDGQLRTVISTRFPLTTAEGEVFGLGTINFDLSARKRIERMKEEFISTVSHELRTPLTALKGALSLVLNDAVGPDPAKLHEMLDIAYRNCDRLGRLIDDILDIERMESGRSEMVMSPVAMPELLSRALSELAPYATEYGVSFKLDGTVPDISVLGNEDALMQVFANLLSNAAKYSPPDATVVISADRTDDGARISITDRGEGIPEAFRPHIFEKFARADGSDTRQHGGSGLGLSIAKIIVERHSGEIGFHDAPGGGTVFHVDLPASTP